MFVYFCFVKYSFAVCILGILFVEAQIKNTPFYINEKQEKWVDSIYRALNWNERVGQLFVVACYTNKDEKHVQHIQHLIEKEKIGGIIFMQDDAVQQLQLTQKFQRISKVPLLIGIDAEWGVSMRLKNTHKFPFALTLGACQDTLITYSIANRIAKDCKLLGIHWNFAPTVDINTNPQNPIIGNRSFGSNPQWVATHSSAFVKGLSNERVLSSAKHFPGHGDTSLDSHFSLPIVLHPEKKLDSTDWQPYKRLIKEGVSGVMVGHLAVPNIDSTEKLPATASKKIVTELLKGKLGFNGLVVTDALNMHGITKIYPTGKAELKALQAGNDVLLFSENVFLAKKILLKEIYSGKLNKKKLEQSIKKILAAKYWAETYKIPESVDDLLGKLNTKEHEILNYTAYSKAYTLLKNDEDVLPLKLEEDEKMYFINLSGEDDEMLIAECRNQGIAINKISLKDVTQLPKNSKVILSILKDKTKPYQSQKVEESVIKVAEEIAMKYQTILCVLSNPYTLLPWDISKFKAVVVGYENNSYTQNLLASFLLGKMPFQGKNPVEVNAQIPFGMGIVNGIKTYCHD